MQQAPQANQPNHFEMHKATQPNHCFPDSCDDMTLRDAQNAASEETATVMQYKIVIQAAQEWIF